MPAKTTCKDYALYYINRFPKTEKELRLQLLKKSYDESDIDQTLSWLKFKNYVNDRNFTKLYIQSELVKKGKAQILIKQKLLEKGIDRHLIQELFAEYETEIQEGMNQKLAQEIEQYKKKGIEGVEIIQKLMRKGYQYRHIANYIRMRDQ